MDQIWSSIYLCIFFFLLFLKNTVHLFVLVSGFERELIGNENNGENADVDLQSRPKRARNRPVRAMESYDLFEMD